MVKYLNLYIPSRDLGPLKNSFSFHVQLGYTQLPVPIPTRIDFLVRKYQIRPGQRLALHRLSAQTSFISLQWDRSALLLMAQGKNTPNGMLQCISSTALK